MNKTEAFLGSEEKGGAYLYQGNTLVIPSDTPDSRIQDKVSIELINSAFSHVQYDSFLVSALDGCESARAITLPKGELPPGWKFIPMRQVMNIIIGDRVDLGPLGEIFRSHHISLWREESRFCGSCGGANRDEDHGGPVRRCTVCDRIEYPRITPAVITMVTNDRDEALLAHNTKFAPGVYSLIAGYNEAGENLEATVAREIKEEVNIEVKDIRYIRSQPWPFPNSLMLGFKARYSGGELRADGIEIEDAKWFSKDNLPALPGNGSVSRYLIGLWLDNKL